MLGHYILGVHWTQVLLYHHANNMSTVNESYLGHIIIMNEWNLFSNAPKLQYTLPAKVHFPGQISQSQTTGMSPD